MLSVIILTKNEEQNLPRALSSVDFADEIVLIDDSSTDKTKAIAAQRKAKVYSFSEVSFAAKREFGAEKAQGDWILHIDADEEVTPELKREIVNTVGDDSKKAYFLRRKDFFWGGELTHGEVGRAASRGFIRLYKKDAGHWRGAVHEEFASTGAAGRFNGFLNHYPHPTLEAFIRSINMYSSVRARELYKAKKNTSVIEILFLPFAKFFYTYILLLGILDGAPGFVYSFMMSFHSFLVRAKLYQYTHSKTT